MGRSWGWGGGCGGEPRNLGPSEPCHQGFLHLLFAISSRYSKILQEVVLLSYAFKGSLWLPHGVTVAGAGRGPRDQRGGSCQVRARNELMASGCPLCTLVFWTSP